MAYPQNTDGDTVHTASHLLATMRNGAANDAATEQLEKLVQAVQLTGKKGTVTIKIEVGKLKDGDTELQVQMKVSSSIPVADIPKGIYYPGEHGSLHRTDPRQLSMLKDDSADRERNLRGVGRGGYGGTTIEHE